MEELLNTPMNEVPAWLLATVICTMVIAMVIWMVSVLYLSSLIRKKMGWGPEGELAVSVAALVLTMWVGIFVIQSLR